MEYAGILSILCFLDVLVSCTIVAQQVPTIQELCPYSSFCSSGPSRLPDSSSGMPCCLPCSCSDMCHLTENCCSDKTPQEAPPAHASSQACKHQEEIYTKLTNSTQPLGRTSYRVIDSCPWERSNASSSHDSSSDCYNTTDIHEMMFVSDAETYDVYLNRFCAECNGVKKVVYWRLRIRCPPLEMLSISSFRERDSYIISTCTMYSTPPTQDIGLHSVCFQEQLIDTCNSTGTWDLYNLELEEQCLTHDHAYVYVNTYANVYCYMCNHPSDAGLPDVCPNINFGDVRFSTVGFTALLQYKEEPVEATTTHMKCRETEVWDPILASCADLMCPLGYLPYCETCKVLVDEWNTLTLEVQLDIDIPNYVVLTKNIDIEILHGVYRLFSVIRGPGCGVCDVYTVELLSGKIAATVKLDTTDTCTPRQLISEVDRILNPELSLVSISEPVINITVQQRRTQIEDVDIARVVDSIILDRCFFELFFGPEIVICPSIRYQLARLQDADIPANAVEEIVSRSKAVNDTDYIVCIEEYLRIYDSVNGLTQLILNPLLKVLVAKTVICFILN